jgi:hypothetical protein
MTAGALLASLGLWANRDMLHPIKRIDRNNLFAIGDDAGAVGR